MKNVKFEYYEWFRIKMSLQLMSIFGFDNNCEKISTWPYNAAQINGVSLND